MNPKQFLSGLFDLTFQKLVVARRLTVEGLYAVCVILSGIGVLGWFNASLVQAEHTRSLWRALGTLVAAPLAFLFIVVMLRLLFESFLALFALAEKTDCLPEDLKETPDSFERR
jgi:tetrahydromethanopterin S-methyltransferase subunit C